MTAQTPAPEHDFRIEHDDTDRKLGYGTIVLTGGTKINLREEFDREGTPILVVSVEDRLVVLPVASNSIAISNIERRS